VSLASDICGTLEIPSLTGEILFDDDDDARESVRTLLESGKRRVLQSISGSCLSRSRLCTARSTARSARRGSGSAAMSFRGNSLRLRIRGAGGGGGGARVGGGGCEENAARPFCAERRDAGSEFGRLPSMAVMISQTVSSAVTLGSFAAARNVIEMGLSSDMEEIGTISLRTLKPGSPGFGSGLTFKPVGTPIDLGPETFRNLLLCRLPAFELFLLTLQIVKAILESFRNLVRSERIESEGTDGRRRRDRAVNARGLRRVGEKMIEDYDEGYDDPALLGFENGIFDHVERPVVDL
jgi:hypothetical protein